MKKTLIAITLCGATQPALAQWGLHGFTEDGLVYEIGVLTGEVEFVGDIGLSVVDASSWRSNWSGTQSALIFTPSDEVVLVNLRDFSTTVLMTIAGRPAGYTPVAFDLFNGGYGVVLDSPSGEDFLYRADMALGIYELVAPLRLKNVVSMVDSSLLTASGEVFDLDSNGNVSLRNSVTLSGQARALGYSGCGLLVSDDGLLHRRSGQFGRVIGNGLGDIEGMAFSSAYAYACEMDTWQFNFCDIFDFLQFQNYFVAGDPWACDCETSTGQGVCDVFDFLCFQNAFIEGLDEEKLCR